MLMIRLEDLYKPYPDQISEIPWLGDNYEYDRELHALGNGHEKFLVVNPEIENEDLVYYAGPVPDTDQCIVLFHENQWVGKVFNKDWEPHWNAYQEIEIVIPKFVWSKNSDIDKLMTFENDPFGNYQPSPWETEYTLVWYLDPRVNPLDDEVWAVSCSPVGKKAKGIKNMGYLFPNIDVEYNEYLPNLGININECYPPFWELENECAYELDPIHQTDQRLWVIKFTPSYKKPRQWRWLGIVSPQARIQYNPKLPKLDYTLDYIIPWHDLKFEHVWYLDRKHLQNDEEDMWAFKIKMIPYVSGTKHINYISPNETIEYNKDLKHVQFEIDDVPYYNLSYKNIWLKDGIWILKKSFTDEPEGEKYIEDTDIIHTIKFNRSIKNLYVDIDYEIPIVDRMYEHVWYTDINNEKIWVAKMSISKKTIGSKEIGTVEPIMPPRLDIVFISYDEPNADKNWERLLEKAPYAKRINGVKGILNAHKAAAELVDTDMFYVVDADAWVTDDWQFDFQPGMYDRDCVYVWNSRNPFNSTTYGYGGIKLFPTSKVKKTVKWGTDLTLSIGKKLKVINAVSNITMFNSSEFNTWRSAFRECAKLYTQSTDESYEKINDWLDINQSVEYAEWALKGAEQGIEYAKNNLNISKVNDYDWLKNMFEELNGRR